MTRVYLVRHGETDCNKRGCYYGWTDCSLNMEGITQSEALSRVFESIEYDIVLSSDLKRAVETANIINHRAKELITDDRLRELNFGLWEGKSYQDIMVQHKEHWSLWLADWKNASPTEGERVADMYERVCRYTDEILKKYKEKSIVIVSHNGALRMLTAYLLGLTMDNIWSFSFEHGRYSLLEIYDDCCVIRGINNI